MDLFLVFRFEHQHICCGSILVPPLFFLSLERAQTVGSLRSYDQVVFLFETEFVRAHVCEALAGLSCNGLSGRPPPSCASLSCCALSISWPFLGFASRIKPSIPPGHVKTPHKENSERAMGPCALPLCPVHGAGYLPPGGHPVSCGREPQCPQAVAKCVLSKCVLSWLQTKWKQELIFSCPWLFSSKPQLVQYWGFPATTPTAPECTLAFVLGCESAFCTSPSHTCAQTELPGPPRLSLPCSLPAFLLPFAQAGLGFRSQNYWWGLNLNSTVCARAALPGLLTPPR